MIVRRVFETFVPHEPEEFLKRLASTNTTATSFGNRELITTDIFQLSRPSVRLLRILGTAFLFLEACLTVIAALFLCRGWRYSHRRLGVSTDRKGGGWMLSRREDRTQDSQDCASCVAVVDLAGGCTAPKEGSKRDSTSKAFCRKRRRGLKQVLLFAMVIRIGLAAEEQSVLMLPLTPSGFQYTVGVTVSGTNYNAVRLHWLFAGDRREVGSARGFLAQVLFCNRIFVPIRTFIALFRFVADPAVVLSIPFANAFITVIIDGY